MHQLKYIVSLALLCATSFCVADIAGIWEGTLEVAPGNTLDVQFTVEQNDDGSIDVVLNSAESGAIKNVKANNASFTDSILKLEVTDLSGSYEGKLENNIITGHWKQLDQTIALNLTPFNETALSDTTIALIEGRWQGIFEPPNNKVNVALTVEKSEPGKVRATFEQLDAGATRVLPDFEIEGNIISFRVGPNGPKYFGTVDGDNISGEIQAPGITFPGNLSKKAFDPREFALDLGDEAEALLKGQWHGEMSTPVGAVAAVFRFEEVEPSLIRGFFDSPDRGASDIPIQMATLENTTAVFKLAGNRNFTGTLQDGTIAGDFTQQGQKLPLTLKKGPLPALALDLSASAQEKLLGNWQGKLKTPRGELNVGIRFEKQTDGIIVAYLDSPDRGLKSARIPFVSFDGGAFTIKSSQLLGIVYTGTLASDNNLKGKFAQGPLNLDLELVKLAE